MMGRGGTSLVVQWLRHHASNAGGTGSIPGWRSKILPAMPRCLKKIYCIGRYINIYCINKRSNYEEGIFSQ